MKAAVSAELDSGRRSSPRRRAFLPGKLVGQDGANLGDCTIRNISDNGAGVDFTADQIVPNRVFLIDMRSGVAYEAEVKWRKPMRIGLFLACSIPLHGVVPENLRHLKQLWETRRAPPKPVNLEVTPEMTSAGVAAYASWKPYDFREQDMVRAVFIAMYGAMPK